ncbi:MAG TPA: translation initiation factor IF-2 [Candidatus Saccharibacteria bacterium]|jgi:translation initiation factor IF-2|nr:translation initiation factor IF-2 [Candidatus Saccharibacteria bacterium]
MDKQTIEIEDQITVGTLAEKLMLPVTRLIGELMKNGVMATVNEQIDFDTAQIIVEELGLDVVLARKTAAPAEVRTARRTNTEGETRPPIIAVMGHVDHGKTSLLDAIRGADTAKKEAGGITQHISAYQVTHNDRVLTLLDTPGHEAFAALREHGARLTDLVVIVVAADDGIKPQTIEAIRFARTAGVKMIVAVNKIDKEGADVPRLKQQLAEQDLLVEEWGGDTIVVEVSAKTKQGIDALLDMILLVADVEELKARQDGPAQGLVIEAHQEHGRGPVAVCLVEEGLLRSGDFVVAGTTYAKVRNLEDPEKGILDQAGPSTPVVITGFKQLPEFGDEFSVVASEKIARAAIADVDKQAKLGNKKQNVTSVELIRRINRTNEVNELPVIIKADVQGSLTSVIDSLKTLDNEEVATRIVSSSVGSINEGDVHLAHTTGAILYGFNVELPTSMKRLASRDKVSVRLYNVIYELLDDAKQELTKLLAPEEVEHTLGELTIKGIFKTTKTEIICGGEVTSGKLTAPALVRISRGKEVLAEAKLTGLKRGPQEAKEVVEGEMCGLSLETTGKVVVEEGDRVEVFTRETVSRQL